MDYKISSRDYLQRARKRLDEGNFESLFYAAWELRCGIESRIQTYLEAHDFISKKLKKGWQVAKLAKGLEEAFENSKKIVRFQCFQPGTKDPLFILIYTPVTPKLQKYGEKLGSYLHAMKIFKRLDDVYWEKLRSELEKIYSELQKANYGTLLGPPLLDKKTGKMQLKMEFPGPLESAREAASEMKNKMGVGSLKNFKVEFLSDLPKGVA